MVSDAAVNSREGFVTASGTATASGGSTPITDSIFILGYQLGCQSDVSTGLQLGGTGGVAGSAGLPLTGVSGTAGLAGFVQTVVQPGVIVDLPLANMSLDESGQGMLDIDNIHITAVPEPASWALLLAGGLVLPALRRRLG